MIGNHNKIKFTISILFIVFFATIYIQAKNSNLSYSEIVNNIKYEIDIKKKSNFTNMIYPRYYHTATKLNDGNIIFIGGGSKFSEIYDVKNKKFFIQKHFTNKKTFIIKWVYII